MRQSIQNLLPLADLLLMSLVYPAAWLLKFVRRVGVNRLPRCRQALLNVGVFPIRNHYYEPQFDHRQPQPGFDAVRSLPGIDWQTEAQLALLAKFSFAGELADLPVVKPARLGFHLNNGKFESGDAEYWYQLIRGVKPRRIIEIGSGHSTLMALRALAKNHEEDSAYVCEHTCIEPNEMPWLD